MYPILYESTEKEFTTNGLGRLSDCTRCVVTEERNGQYELELDYPITGIHYSDIAEERIICAAPADGKDPQPFDIYKISKPLNGVVTVYAHHISYRLKKQTVLPFTASTINAALESIASGIVGGTDFEFWTDKTTAVSYAVSVPMQVRAVLGGEDNSLLDVFGGGEYLFDKFLVKLYQNRGSDNGVTIRYGKNLIDVTKETDIEDVYTGVIPYWKGTVTSGSTSTEEIVVGNAVYSHASEYTNSMVIPLDLSTDFDSKPSKDDLETAAAAYLESNKTYKRSTNIEVDFIALWQTEEYKDVACLQRVNLCDYVTVIYDALGVNDTLEVISTEYDVLAERYNTIELGNAKTTMENAITVNVDNEIKNVQTSIGSEIASATKLITGGAGGYVVIGRNANGQPEELYIMDTDSTDTATNVIRINKNGIGFSKSGFNGPYTSAWTIDGAFVADFITAGTLSGSLIRGGTIEGVTFISDNDTTKWKTEIEDGAVETYGVIGENSHRVGSICAGATGATTTGDYPSYYIVADTHAKAIVLAQHSSDTKTDASGYYYLNLGANPDGYTERHVFYGASRFRGNIYANSSIISDGTSIGSWIRMALANYTLNKATSSSTPQGYIKPSENDEGSFYKTYTTGGIYLKNGRYIFTVTLTTTSTDPYAYVALYSRSTSGSYTEYNGFGDIFYNGSHEFSMMIEADDDNRYWAINLMNKSTTQSITMGGKFQIMYMGI